MVDISHTVERDRVVVRIEDGDKTIAYAYFVERPNRTWYSAYTHVEPERRGYGYPEFMYEHMHKLGCRIKPSNIQSPEGKRMWKRFREKKLPFAKETLFEKLLRTLSV